MPSHNSINLIGKRFGRLLVTSRGENFMLPNGKIAEASWVCRCDCGNIITIRGSLLRKNVGGTKSCGCLRNGRKPVNLAGKRFGRLLAMEINSARPIKWLCKCDCGNTCIVASTNLVWGDTKSCGCVMGESYIASEVKKYMKKNYNANIEYKAIRNPYTKRWLPYDIYVSNKNTFIEIHGSQHYKFTKYFHKDISDFVYNNFLDDTKKRHAVQSGRYIEIDLRKIKTVEQAINYIEQRI